MTAAPTGADAGRLPQEAAGRLIAELYVQHGRALYGVCRMLLRDPHEAEDATQSAYLSAYGALVRGGLPRDRTAWIFAIARNECRTRIRAGMSIPITTGDEALDGLPAPMGDPAERLPDATLQKALQALSPRQREAVVLHDVYGLRAREVGRALGVSLPAVEALLFRARRQLRLRLQPVAGVLTLPVGLRDALAAAIPGFGDGSGAAGAAVTGAAGLGLLAKLASAPSAAKVAAAAVAVGAAGSVAVVDSQPGRPPKRSTLVAADGTTVGSAAPGKAAVTSPAVPTTGRTIGRRSRVVTGDEDGTRSGRGNGEDASQRDDGAAPTGASPDHEDGDTSDGATTRSREATDDHTDTRGDGAHSGPGGGGTSASGPGDGDGEDEKAAGPESPDADVDDPVGPEDESEPDDGDSSGSGSGGDGGSAVEDEDEESSGSGSSRSGNSGSSSSGDGSPDEDEPDDEDGTD